MNRAAQYRAQSDNVPMADKPPIDGALLRQLRREAAAEQQRDARLANESHERAVELIDSLFCPRCAHSVDFCPCTDTSQEPMRVSRAIKMAGMSLRARRWSGVA